MGVSKDLQHWIEDEIKDPDRYDSLDMFTYTNESLAEFLRTCPLHVRCLIRNWVVEKGEEEEAKKRSIVEGTAPPLKERNKSVLARRSGVLLNAQGPGNRYLSLNHRYYNHAPLFKGALLWDSRSTRKAVYVGFYKWNPKRKGTPFVGYNWCAFKVSDAEGIQSELIDSIQSRFNYIWEKNSVKFEDVLLEEEQFDIDKYARSVWEVGELPYKIVFPGEIKVRSSAEHAVKFPEIKHPDALAAENTKAFLTKLGAKASIAIMPLPDY